MLIYILINGFLSLIAAYVSYRLVCEFMPIFIRSNMYGRDQCKADSRPIPEPMGFVTAAVYLIVMFVFIPFPFIDWAQTDTFPHDKFLAFLSGLLSISCAILLGFADDVLDLRWRHKLMFPTLSSLPVLMVYFVTGHSTQMVIPTQLHFLLGSRLDIGPFYYVYMGMMVVFCTNAVNILAGINGLEAGQSLIIASSVVLFNIIQIMRVESQTWYHTLSLYFLLPFLATCAVLLYFNWYPAQVFVGDTFCYWSGMTLAVVSILGHFSKTMALFFIPQIINFLYSIPQLFRILPCPRHRLPRFNPESNTVDMSKSEFKNKDIKILGKICLAIFDKFGLVYKRQFEKDGEMYTEINNLTVINLCLKCFGPMHERTLTELILAIQFACSILAFFIRFFMASLIYDVVH